MRKLLTIGFVAWTTLMLSFEAQAQVYYQNVCAWSISTQCARMRANGTAERAGVNWARRNGYMGLEHRNHQRTAIEKLSANTRS
jgi:hypothetical protein